MIRIYTDHALSRKLRQHRRDLAAQFADAIETLLPEDCPHNNRPSCPRCAQRRTAEAAAVIVRDTGGVRQREETP